MRGTVDSDRRKRDCEGDVEAVRVTVETLTRGKETAREELRP